MTLPHEQAQLQESLERRLAELSEELKAANLRLEALEVSDPLTGLANRRRLSEALDTEWKRALRQQAPVGMVLVDVDLFKLFNGHYGHLSGDECLRRVARVLSSGVRGGGDLVARYGGDEFIMLLPGAGKEVATVVAERVRSGIEALRQPHARADRGVVTVSAGVATLQPSAGSQPGDLIELAEAALYQAKKKGRNTVAGVAEHAGERARSAALSLLRMPERAPNFGAAEEARADPRPGAPVSLLVIEDSDLDAELIVRELRRGLAGLRWRRVQTEDELRSALDSEAWDAVICDYHLPEFGALPALAMVRARPDYVPFILVSGVVRDETAVEAMKQGVDDYVLKNNLARLAPAVVREVKANETRRSNARAAESLRESESRFRQIAEAIRDVFILHDVDEHRVLYANPAFEAVWGYTREALYADRRMWERAIHPEDFKGLVRAFRTLQPFEREHRLIRADGEVRWMNCRCFPIRDEHGHCRRLVVVSADVTEQRAARERLDFLAYYDEVTGLPNRHLFELRLAEAVQAAQARGGKLAVVVSDIDGFKNINDTLGPAAGNELLRQVGMRLADAASDDAVIRAARIGADQFVGLATRVGPREEMDRHMQSALRAIFGKPFVVEGSELRVAAKLGIAIYPDHGGDAVTVFRNAEAALKKAKATGEPYLFFDEKMTQQVAGQLALVNKLRRALERSEFVLHYQPKVEIDSRRVVGVEALLRWNDPSSGRQVPPAEFIPLLEDTGLIGEVGAWAIGQAARDQQAWRSNLPAGTPPPRVAVNVSAIQLRRGDFVKTVREAIGAGAPAAQAGIDLEITESLIMEDFEGNVEKLQALRAMGVNVAIDDFGTGYSSLAYLARLPVETLKIDRSFVDAMLGDPNIMTVVTAIMTLAHSFRLKVVAEGVETEEQVRMLSRLRCDQMQGYLFSRPVPAERIPALLKTGGPEKPVT